MLTSDIEVSIIIPNLHSPVIGEVLDAIRAQDYDLSRTEILVVGLDRHQLVQEDRLVRFISTEEPVSPARARNLGAALSMGELLLFLDADCVPQVGWLANLLEAHQRWPEAGAISAAMLPEAESFVLHCGQIAGFHEHLSVNHSGARRLLASFSLLMTRPVWNLVGGFDPTLKIAEDVDISVRLLKLSRQLYLETRARVLHRPRRGGWRALWRHAFASGKDSIFIRERYADWFKFPRWTFHPWVWRLFSPAIAVLRALEIYVETPGLWRYWKCLLWTVISKLAWCWGAATGREQQGGPILQSGVVHD